MLSQSMNSPSGKLHDELFEEVKVLFLKLAVVEGTDVKIKNNLPALARVIFKNSQVKLGKDLLPVANILIQIRNDGYDIGGVIEVIGIAYHSVIEQKKPRYSRKKTTMPNFGADLAGVFNDDFMNDFMKNGFNRGKM